MNQNLSHPDEPTEYPDLPSSRRDSPEARAARVLDDHAREAQGRLALGCCIIWLGEYDYLLTSLAPMGDVRGGEAWMTIYTAEHLVTIRGENLHLLAVLLKQQRIDDLRVTAFSDDDHEAKEWVITSITAETRGDESKSFGSDEP